MRGVNDLAVALPHDSTASPRERRAFKFFRERTAPCVSGYFHDSVWNQSVLQLSHSEPAILHALTALSALHEEKVLTKENGADVALVNSPHAFAITQYSKALNEMRTLLNESQVCLNKVLVCAMLCIHFETLRESFVPALLHVDNVIKLLHSPTIVDAQDVDPNLVRVIMRMDLQGIYSFTLLLARPLMFATRSPVFWFESARTIFLCIIGNRLGITGNFRQPHARSRCHQHLDMLPILLSANCGRRTEVSSTRQCPS